MPGRLEQQGAGSLFVTPKRVTFAYNDNSQFTRPVQFAKLLSEVDRVRLYDENVTASFPQLGN